MGGGKGRERKKARPLLPSYTFGPALGKVLNRVWAAFLSCREREIIPVLLLHNYESTQARLTYLQLSTGSGGVEVGDPCGKGKWVCGGDS